MASFRVRTGSATSGQKQQLKQQLSSGSLPVNNLINAVDNQLVETKFNPTRVNGHLNTAFELEPEASSTDSFRFERSDDFRTILSQMETGSKVTNGKLIR